MLGDNYSINECLTKNLSIMSFFRTMGQPNHEAFTIKTKVSKKTENRTTLAAIAFMIVMFIIAILIA